MRRSLGGVSGTDTLLVKQNTRIPPYVRTDLMLLNKIRRSKRRMPRQLRKLLQRLVSENPLNDLSVLVWLMFLAALPFRGFPLLFTFFANYFLALILGMLISSRRPWQLDRRLKPQVRVSGSAFPCLELWLAAVTFLSIGTAYPSPASVLGLLALFCLLLYTRLATLAYFTVQLLGSCLLGCAGWAACEVLKATVLRNGVHRQVILVGAILTVMAFLGHVAYLAERNQSAVLAVPKAEYLRVMGDIMDRQAAEPQLEESLAGSFADEGGGELGLRLQRRRAQTRAFDTQSRGGPPRTMLSSLLDNMRASEEASRAAGLE